MINKIPSGEKSHVICKNLDKEYLLTSKDGMFYLYQKTEHGFEKLGKAKNPYDLDCLWTNKKEN